MANPMTAAINIRPTFTCNPVNTFVLFLSFAENICRDSQVLPAASHCWARRPLGAEVLYHKIDYLCEVGYCGIIQRIEDSARRGAGEECGDHD
jgi:hypothetical protein